MRARLAILFSVALFLALAASCNGTTGYDLVQFHAAGRGFSDAVKGNPYVFTTAAGVRVTLTKASLHVGALYLTQSVPQSGGGPQPCVLPQTYAGAFVGEVRGDADIDLLDPGQQPIDVAGDGSTLPAAAGQVWLVHDSALTQGTLNGPDDQPVLTLEGSWDDGAGGTSTFSAGITITTSRVAGTVNPGLPSEAQVCQDRIVSAIPASLTLAQGGTLTLGIDRASLFVGVPFTDLPTASQLASSTASACVLGSPSDTCFTNDDSNLSSRALFSNLRATGPYAFSWTSSPGGPVVVDGGTQGGGSCVSVAATSGTSGFKLPVAPCVDSSGLSPGQLLLTASGEVLALEGYTFPDPNGTFADGWQINFQHYIATFDKVSLWNDPDSVPTDQSQVGSLVAELDGPWAVDMHLNGPSFPYIDGKESGARAVAFAVLTGENKNGNAPFPTDGTRLAVGFSAVLPTPKALNVNLDADGLDAYEYMIQNQCTVYYRGTATWVGNTNGGKCVAPGDGDAGVSGATPGTGGEAEFANIPRVVNFDFCFKPADLGGLQPGDPETSYINCDNQDNDPATPLNGEPHQRGIAFPSDKYVIGEVTFHTDHPFWESTQHDTPARFDAFAAQVSGPTDGGVPTVHFTDVRGANYLAFTDRQGRPLPWRTCDPAYENPNGGSRVGQMHYDPVRVPQCMNGNHATGLCDYYDFSKYNQSTQGHWNGSDGLCFVQRHYPSPP